MSRETIPAREVLDFIDRERAVRDCHTGVLHELIGDMVGVRGNTVEKWLRTAARTGRCEVGLADAIVTALDGAPDAIPSLDVAVPPTSEGWCPACREQVIATAPGGVCVWCDTPVTEHQAAA